MTLGEISDHDFQPQEVNRALCAECGMTLGKGFHLNARFWPHVRVEPLGRDFATDALRVEWWTCNVCGDVGRWEARHRCPVERGTCALCGQEMLKTDDDCWHPWNVAVACPPEHGANGVRRPEFGAFGRPGREHFVPLRNPWPNEVRP